MNEQEYLEKISEEYRKEGYAVITHPTKDQLPANLGDLGIDILARRGKEVVAVQLKSRGQLYDLNDVRPLTEQVKVEPGWRLDVVVFPPEGGVEVTRDSAELGAAQIQSLTEEATQALGVGAVRASFVVAWSAAEAAMREAARREGLAIEREAPRFVLKTLYSNGVISREDYERIERCLHVRNAIVHGFAPPAFEGADVVFLIDFARRLLSPEPAQADA